MAAPPPRRGDRPGAAGQVHKSPHVWTSHHNRVLAGSAAPPTAALAGGALAPRGAAPNRPPPHLAGCGGQDRGHMGGVGLRRRARPGPRRLGLAGLASAVSPRGRASAVRLGRDPAAVRSARPAAAPGRALRRSAGRTVCADLRRLSPPVRGRTTATQASTRSAGAMLGVLKLVATACWRSSRSPARRPGPAGPCSRRPRQQAHLDGAARRRRGLRGYEGRRCTSARCCEQRQPAGLRGHGPGGQPGEPAGYAGHSAGRCWSRAQESRPRPARRW